MKEVIQYDANGNISAVIRITRNDKISDLPVSDRQIIMPENQTEDTVLRLFKVDPATGKLKSK